MGFWQQPERKGLVERRLTTSRALEVPSHCQRGFRNTEQKRRPRQGQAVALLRRGAEFGTEGGHRAKHWGERGGLERGEWGEAVPWTGVH